MVGRLVRERGSRKREKNPQWVAGHTRYYYKKRAEELYGTHCDMCGKDGAHVHHLDGNKMNNPHDGSNWQMLCSGCHNRIHGCEIRDEKGRFIKRDYIAKAINRPYAYPSQPSSGI